MALMACGRLEVFDDDVIAYACTLCACGVKGPEIARKLVIPSGKNKGRNPSGARLCRILADDGRFVLTSCVDTGPSGGSSGSHRPVHRAS
ncbi:hypothetical protein [Nonomuraea sp. NPDC003754]